MSAEGKKSNKGFIALLVMIIVCACLMIAAVTTLGIGMAGGMNGGEQQGPQGEKGEQGLQGAAGSMWSSGEGNPAGTAGADGDFYLDTTTGNVWQKKNGTWTNVLCIKADTPRISKGENGETAGNWYVGNQDQGVSATQTFEVSIDQDGFWCVNGVQTTHKATAEVTIKDGYWYIDGVKTTVKATAEWFTDEGAPDPSKGANGDMYLDLTNGDIYKRTAENGWGTPVGNINGTLGTGRSVWYAGEGDPEEGLDPDVNAPEGSYYFDVKTGDVYKFEEGSWSAEPVTNFGIPAEVPYIDVSAKDGKNHWFVGGKDTGVVAEGQNGRDAFTPYILDGYWVVDGNKTTYKATGDKGEDGITPHIGPDGYWYFGAEKTTYKATGDKGENGTMWYSGTKDPLTTAPEAGDLTHEQVLGAVVGDFYFNTTTGDIYRLTATQAGPTWGTPLCNFSVRFENNEWIVNGKHTGIFAMSWYNGTGNPDDIVKGHPGDHYLDTKNGVIYKNVTEAADLDSNLEGKAWEEVVTIRGTKWFTGAEDPDEYMNFGVGLVAGDLYFQQGTYQIWQYNGSKWERIDGFVLKGEKGDRGTRLFAGKSAPDEYFKDVEDYEVGDFYFWTSKGILYTYGYDSGEEKNVWIAANENDPLAGTKWLSGKGEPDINTDETLAEQLETAIEGDVYLDLDSNVLYQYSKVEGTSDPVEYEWKPLGTLVEQRATKWFYGAYDPTAEGFKEEDHIKGAINGDFYLQTFSAFTGLKGFKMFVRENDGWVLLVNMTEEDTDPHYDVPNYGTLVQFRDSVNKGNDFHDNGHGAKETVTLTGKFDITEEEFGTIGDETHPFSGIFDGGNVENKEEGLFIGGLTGPLFGYLKDAEIKNVYLQGSLDTAKFALKTFFGAKDNATSLLANNFGLAEKVEGTCTFSNVTLKLEGADGTVVVKWNESGEVSVEVTGNVPAATALHARRSAPNSADGYALKIENELLALGEADFTFTNVAFAGTTYLDVTDAKSLTLNNCYADVTPVEACDRDTDGSVTSGEVTDGSSAAAFIVSRPSSSARENALKLTVTGSVILAAQSDAHTTEESDETDSMAILVNTKLASVTLSGNKFGSTEKPYTVSVVKLPSLDANAEVILSENIVYGVNKYTVGEDDKTTDFAAFVLNGSSYSVKLDSNQVNALKAAEDKDVKLLSLEDSTSHAQVYFIGTTNQFNTGDTLDHSGSDVMYDSVKVADEKSFDFIAFFAELQEDEGGSLKDAKIKKANVYLGNNFGVDRKDFYDRSNFKSGKTVDGDTNHDVVIIDLAFADPSGFTQHVADFDTNYYVNNANGLASFRDMVNGTYKEGVDPNSFTGKTVLVTTDIDLDNKPWTPIGGNDATKAPEETNYTCSNAFSGVFTTKYDGTVHTISNLKIVPDEETEKTGLCLGLFGYVDGANAALQDIHITNVSITANNPDKGSVGALVGKANTYKAISNITVDGKITIEATGYRDVGGVVGRICDPSGLDYVIIEGTDGDAIISSVYYSEEAVGNGKVGGILGFTGAANTKFSNLSAKHLQVAGYRNVGGLIGILQDGSEVNVAAVQHVTLTIRTAVPETEVQANEYARNIGAVAGSVSSADAKLTIKDVVATEVAFNRGFALMTGKDVSRAIWNNGFVGGVHDEYVAATISNEYLNENILKAQVDDDLIIHNGVYQIVSPMGLVNFSKLITEGKLDDDHDYRADTTGMKVWLMDDLNVAGLRYTSAALSDKPFLGEFDGKGMTITGLTGSLFGYTGEKASIHDLTLKDVAIASEGDTVGALVASATGTTIKKIAVSGSVKGGNNVGALVGELNASTVNDVTVSGTVTGGYNVGGLVGVTKGETKLADITVDAAVAKTDNLADAMKYARSIGGLVGAAEAGLTVGGITVTGSLNNNYRHSLNYLVYNYGLVGSVAEGSEYAKDEWVDGLEVLPAATFTVDNELSSAAQKFTGSVNVYIAATDLHLTATFSATGDKQAHGVLVTAETVKGLNSVAELVNHGITFEDETVMLAKDITLEAEDANAWTPIGVDGHVFKGTFSGAYEDEKNEAAQEPYKITNLRKALFGALEGATVKHLVLNNVFFTPIADSEGPAALVAYSAKNVKIDNITVDGTTQTTVSGGKNSTAKANNVAAAPYGVVGKLEETNAITNVTVKIAFVDENVTFTAEVDKDSNSKLVYTGENTTASVVKDESFLLSGFTGKELDVTFTGIKFTGNSYVEIQNTNSFTMTGCYADVAPDDGENGREAFIRSSTVGSKGIKLDIEDNTILVKSSVDKYAPAIFVLWNPIQNGSIIKGNTIGDATHRHSFAAVKLGDFAENAVVTIEGNTVYGGDGYWFCAFDFFQTADNAKYAYTVNLKGNKVNFKTTLDAQPGGNKGEYCFAYVESSETTQSHAKIFVGADNSIVYNGAEKGRNVGYADVCNWVKAGSENVQNAYFIGYNVEWNDDGEVTSGDFVLGQDTYLLHRGSEYIEMSGNAALFKKAVEALAECVADGSKENIHIVIGDDFGRRLSDLVDESTKNDSIYYIFSTVGFKSFFDLQNNGFNFHNKTIEFSEEYSEELGNTHTLDLGTLATALGMTAWTPIGTEENPFKGTFNGGYLGSKSEVLHWNITGLKYNGDAKLIGFFGYTDGAKLMNLDLLAFELQGSTTAERYTGMLVAHAKDTDISNINLSGSTLKNYIGTAGALAGYLEGGTVSDITVNTTTLNATYTPNVGAVIGVAKNITIGNVYVGGSLGSEGFTKSDTVSVTASFKLGGIIGVAEEGITLGTLKGEPAPVYSAAEVSAQSVLTDTSLQIGGIIGALTAGAGAENTFDVQNAHFVGKLDRVSWTDVASTKYANYGLVGGYTTETAGTLTIKNSDLKINHFVDTKDEEDTFAQDTKWYTVDDKDNFSSEYQITGKEGLKFFRDQVNGGNTYSEVLPDETIVRETVHLMTDITFEEGETWEPIGNDEAARPYGTPAAEFRGIFTGKKDVAEAPTDILVDGVDSGYDFDPEAYTITNLQVLGHNAHNRAEACNGGNNMGLFGRTHEAVIEYLNIDGATVTGNLSVGTIVGTGDATSLNHITVANAVVRGHSYVGGLAGHNDCNDGCYDHYDEQVTYCKVVGLKGDAVPEKIMDGETPKFDYGAKLGGLVGFSISCAFDHNLVAATNLTAYLELGGLVGYDNGTIGQYTDNTVENTNILIKRNGYTKDDDPDDEMAGYGQEYEHKDEADPENAHWMVGGNHKLTETYTEDHIAKRGINVEEGFNNVNEGTTVKHTAPESANGLTKGQDAWYIFSAEGLNTFRSLVNDGATTHNGKEFKLGFEGETVSLELDVDLSAQPALELSRAKRERAATIDAAADWTPIGTDAKPFKGTFNGLGHTVTGLTISKGNNVGFFGCIVGSSKNLAGVKNLTLENVSVTGGENVGTLAGSVSGATISNVTVESETAVAGTKSVGGLVGTAAKGGVVTLEDVTVNVGVSNTTDTTVGGLVGTNNADTLSIKGSEYKGGITLPDGATEKLPDHAFVGDDVSRNLAVEDSASEVTNDTAETPLEGLTYGQAAGSDGEVHAGYLINSVEGLKALATLVNNGTERFAGKYIFLTGDIDLKGEDWTPIGTEGNRFMGTFDGLGHTISNINVSGEKYVGLFGLVGLNETDPTECAIKSLKIGGVNTVTVNGTAYDARNDAGLLVGYAANVAFSNITVLADAKVTVKGVPADGVYGPNAVGGLVGASQSCTYDTIKTECAVIRVDNKGGIMVGGIIGLSMHDELSNFEIKNTWVDGNFAVGGLIGTAFGRESLQNVHVGGNVYMNYWWYYTNVHASKFFAMVGGLIGTAELDSGEAGDNHDLTIDGSSFNGSITRVNLYFTGDDQLALYDLPELSDNGLVGSQRYGTTPCDVKITNTNLTVDSGSSKSNGSLYGHDETIKGTYNAEGEFTPVEG